MLRDVKQEKNPNAREHAANEHTEADKAEDTSLATLAMRAAVGSGATVPPPTPPANGASGDSGTPLGSTVYLGLQQRFGNKAVQRILVESAIQRAPDPPQPTPPPADKPAPQKRDPEIQRAGISPKVLVAGTANDPTEMMSKSADIALQHGSHEAVAWTTPNWDFKDPVVADDGSTVSLQYSLSFLIDLPNDYDASKVEMLRQHEHGHVEIAKKKAKEAFEVNLKGKLEGMTDVTKDQVVAEVRTAMDAAKSAEKEGSTAYDAAEYPLMIERYKGIKDSLAQLSKTSGAIAGAARVLQSVPGILQRAKLVGDPSNLQDLSAKVQSAKGALSTAETARIQFNSEFQGLANSAKGAADQLINEVNMLPGIGEHHDELVPAVQAISAACAGFAFSAAGASAAY